MTTKAALENEVERLDRLAQSNREELIRVRADLNQTRKDLKIAEHDVTTLRYTSLQARAAIAAFMAAHYAAAQLNAYGSIEPGNFGNQLDGIKEPTQFEANGLLLLHLAELLSPAPSSAVDVMRNY